jgi:HEAT repeat protein
MTDTESAEELLEQIRSETNKYELASLLRRLAKCERVPADARLLGLVGDSRWIVRREAIQALSQCAEPAAEDCLLERARITGEVYDFAYINATLGKIGSRKSIPYLSEMAGHREEDVAASAIAALSEIGSSDELPIFLQSLSRGRRVVRWCAMAAISRHGDESAIGPVVGRVKQILKRKRKQEQRPRSELGYALEFLCRMRRHDARIDGLFAWVLGESKDMLFETERAFVEQLVGEKA